MTDSEILGAMKNFPAVWERVAGGLEVANENYNKDRRAKPRGRRGGFIPVRAALCLYLLLLLLANGEKITRRDMPG